MLAKIPAGLDAIIDTFGDLDDPMFEQRNIVSFDLPYQLLYSGKPVRRSRCHRLAVDNFVQAFKNVDAAGLAGQFTEYNGIYARRSIRGRAAHPSCHSWGIAIDMGASTHPLGKWTPWPEPILQAFTDTGFFWGGLFKSRKDCMHWQLATHY